MLTIEERVAVVGAPLHRLSYAQVQEEFRRKFHKPAPTRANIRLLVNKFQRTGNVSDAPCSGRPAVPEETVARIREAIERSPEASTRGLSNELDVPRATVLKILRFTLKKRTYHIQVLHKLDEEDYAARKAVPYNLMEAVNNENLFEHIVFSDEATFHTCGKVNKHNCRIWGNEPPHTTHEWQRDTPKVNVWLGFTKSTVYGPFMLEQDGILDSVVFQQDGAPPHFALAVRAYLNQRFPNRWIGRGSPQTWPSRSPDLTPLDFFAWGFIKAQVYHQTKVRDLHDLKNRIREACAAITGNMLSNVFRATCERWEQCYMTWMARMLN
ncbi:hypothetical protein C0J52_14568 [Blattella germanica]|nr:hypothetical protein C0J52_14568 [Blattella germanica]